MKNKLCYVSATLTLLLLAGVSAAATDGQHGDTLVLTSSNDPNANQVVVFKLNSAGTPSLSLVTTLPTGGKGGASGNAGSVQFRDYAGAVVNYGSNTLSRMVRDDGSIRIEATIPLASSCVQPVSVAITDQHALVVGSNCVESHS